MQICPDSNLSYERFKELLLTLEQYGFPQLRDTPTGFRLHEIILVKFSGGSGQMVRQDLLLPFIGELVNNANDKQIEVSFEILDKIRSGAISLQQFLAFVGECWVSAFRLLSSLVQQETGMKTSEMGIELWANQNKSEFLKRMSEDFKRFDEKKGVGAADQYLTYENFKLWAKSSTCNSIYAALAGFEVMIPLHIFQQNLNTCRQEAEGGFINLKYGDQR